MVFDFSIGGEYGLLTTNQIDNCLQSLVFIIESSTGWYKVLSSNTWARCCILVDSNGS